MSLSHELQPVGELEGDPVGELVGKLVGGQWDGQWERPQAQVDQQDMSNSSWADGRKRSN